MSKVIGRVVLQGTDVGIPRLLVAIYDAHQPTAFNSPWRGPFGTGDQSNIRWGSVITDDRAFLFILDDRPGGEANVGDRGTGLELVLVVSGLEERICPRWFFASSARTAKSTQRRKRKEEPWIR